MVAVPSSHGMSGAMWITQDMLVANSNGGFRTFDFRTQKWSDLTSGDFDDFAGPEISLRCNKWLRTEVVEDSVRRPSGRNDYKSQKLSSRGGSGYRRDAT